MPKDQLAAIQKLDPSVLSKIVREDQRSPSFEILDWTAEPVPHEKVSDTTGGLFRVHGTGKDSRGEIPWTIVLKVVLSPGDAADTPGEFASSQDPSNWSYWKRELLAFQSGTLAELTIGINTPRCYETTETAQSGWLWMENIVESGDRRWSMEHYHRAARHTGRFAAAFLCGAPLPKFPWLSAPFFRSLFADGSFFANRMDPTMSANVWQNSLVQKSFSDVLRSGVLQLWGEKKLFWRTLDSLPQVFCHNDFHRRNLMFRKGTDAQEELIALDWAFCGPGAIGMDVGGLVALSTFFFDADPAQVGELEATVLDGYLAGLRDGGWSGDPRLARLGYLLSAVLRKAAVLPSWTAYAFAEDSGLNVEAVFGRPAEDVLAGWLTLTEFLLERADEARHLMRTLDMS